jgi:hypothetical protein
MLRRLVLSLLNELTSLTQGAYESYSRSLRVSPKELTSLTQRAYESYSTSLRVLQAGGLYIYGELCWICKNCNCLYNSQYGFNITEFHLDIWLRPAPRRPQHTVASHIYVQHMASVQDNLLKSISNFKLYKLVL